MKTGIEQIINLLKDFIKIPSFSKQEEGTADILFDFFKNNQIESNRIKNNIWAYNRHFDPEKKTILLNSHHDTVKDGSGWTLDPFEPVERNGKIYGLGSNDAGASLVSLLAAFLHYYDLKGLNYNLVFLASAEEEISGKNGIELALTKIGNIDFGIVGEPTKMDMAITEKGLMVLDCVAMGESGHSAREEGKNAIYVAVEDIDWIRNFNFPKISKTLGLVKMTVTLIDAGSQHNVVPDLCKFVIDVRSTDCYKNEEILKIIKGHIGSKVSARSTRLQATGISQEHILIKAARNLGITTFGSVTLSDQALMPFPTVKMGPGDSSRSHSANEYIYTDEIEEGINIYIQLLHSILISVH